MQSLILLPWLPWLALWSLLSLWLMAFVVAIIDFLDVSVLILHKMFGDNRAIFLGDVDCLMGAAVLIDPPVAAVHALVCRLGPVIRLVGESLFVLPAVHLVVVSACVLPIEGALCISLEVPPHLCVALSLRARLVFGGVDVSGVGGEDWRPIGLRSGHIDAGVIGSLVAVPNADSEGGLGNLLAVDEGGEEAEAECFLDVHAMNYF